MTFAKVLSWLNDTAETIETGGEVASDLKKEVTGLLRLYAKKGMGELGEQCLEDLVEVIVVMVTKQVAEKVQQTREVQVGLKSTNKRLGCNWSIVIICRWQQYQTS